MKRVRAGSKRREGMGEMRAIHIGDEVRPQVRPLIGLQGFADHEGPRSEPPMPMLTTSVIVRPSRRATPPSLTRSEKRRIFPAPLDPA